MPDILLQRDGAVAVLKLNRPDMLNAFNVPMVDAWADALGELQADPEVSVIVLTGAGRGFCSGVELGSVPAGLAASEHKDRLWNHVYRVAFAMQLVDKPVIAAINGPAVGAGFDMALMCDIRLAARSAVMSEGYIKVGLVPGDGGTWYLPRIVGVAKALELLWTGDTFTGEEAVAMGLVTAAFDDAELMPATLALAARIASRSPRIVQTIKRAVYQGLTQDLRTALDMVSSHAAVVRTTAESERAFGGARQERTRKTN
jgi:enoyl-CoA hydratase/carnithine racemase